MKVSELYIKLEKAIDNGYGNLEVVDANDEDLEYVELQKFINRKHPCNRKMIVRETEDLDQHYLEDIYKNNDKYKDSFVSEGKCVKIY